MTNKRTPTGSPAFHIILRGSTQRSAVGHIYNGLSDPVVWSNCSLCDSFSFGRCPHLEESHVRQHSGFQ